MTSKLKQKETVIAFILDRSSSMSSCLDATISGFNEYVRTLNDDKKSKYNMSLTLFNTSVDTEYTNVPISKVSDLDRKSYVPNGMTALYDAVGMTIEATEKTLTKDQKVLCVIMTDGEENASREYTTEILTKKIKELEKQNWTFVFLGANQDAWATGKQFGLHRGNVVNYHASSLGNEKAFRTVANNTAFYAQSAENTTRNFFSEEDKDDLGKAK